MSAAAVPADTVPPRPAWRSLLWIAPGTVLWTLLIYWQPAIPESSGPTTAARLITYALIAVGSWLGLERTDLTPGQRRTTWLAVMVPFTLWAAAAWSAAINGVFRTGVSALPVLPLAIFLPVIIGAPLVLLSKRVGEVLNAMPVTWLVALQLYRVVGSIFLAAGLRGALPSAFALPAGIGDVLTGLLAVPAALAVATGTARGRKAAIVWNVFGPCGLRRRDYLGADHLARAAAVDRSECAEHRRRRLPECADPGFRGAKLDLAARAVAAPADPTICRLIAFHPSNCTTTVSRRMEGWSNAR